ncbi:hypothetical protein H7849_17210 [Alloacidobacterium dinghuense]|uniref:Uncharacterized protein n=1 Tax=Alloacidobacterium dinghuense TaxID=2763107 RepID=A0A7G8BE75_9BACT|nr:hypothetical protein [Alloacidobacterium dinghuense]QNI30845.1 hypothetical protein H7849_17210 [Alloacidobacterium dinghuense]
MLNLVTGFVRTELGKHATIAAVLIVASFVTSSIAYWHASHLAREWVSPLRPHYGLREPGKAGFCKPPGQVAGAVTLRLEDDVQEVQGRIQHHLNVMIYFYANYYRAIIMSSILGAVSGICLFYIANKGWATASNYVVTTFVISTVIGAYFFSLIAVFKEQDNITANKALYLQYVALGNRIASYCATGSTENAQPETLDSYVHQVDTQMAAINDVAISLDSGKVADYKALLQQEMNSKQKLALPPVEGAENTTTKPR